MQKQIFETPVLGIKHKFTVLTQGRFSCIVGPYWIKRDVLKEDIVFSAFLVSIFDAFEKKFGLKILGWRVQKVVVPYTEIGLEMLRWEMQKVRKNKEEEESFERGEIEILVSHEPKEPKKAPNESHA